MPLITDHFSKASNGTPPVVTTLASQKTMGASSLSVSNATGWDTSTPVHLLLYQLNAQNAMVPGSLTIWKGILSGTTVASLTLRGGTDTTYPGGSVCELAPTNAWADDLIAGLLIQHNQDGSHHGLTSDTISTTSTVTSGGLLTASNGLTVSAGAVSLPNNSIPSGKLIGINVFGYLNSVSGTPPAAGTGQFYMQCGTTVIGASPSDMPLPLAFPNGLLTVVGFDGDGTGRIGAVQTGCSNSNIRWQTPDGTPRRIDWFAIGF